MRAHAWRRARGLAVTAVVALGACGVAAPDALALAAALVAPGVPASESAPGITGSAVAGQTLTEKHAAWSNTPTSYGYQWDRCDGYGQRCTPISGATTQTYAVTVADVGHTLRVRESATNAAGTSGAVSSAATAIVSAPGKAKGAPANAGLPLIDGAAYVGGRLQASPGAWAGAAPMSYAYQWERCHRRCTNIRRATKSAYTPVRADRGARIRVVVRASDAAGVGHATSKPTAPAGPSNASIRLPMTKALPPAASARTSAALLAAHGYTTVFVAPLKGRLSAQCYYVPQGAHVGPPIAPKGQPQPVLVAQAAAIAKRRGKVKLTFRLTADGIHLLQTMATPSLTAQSSFIIVGRPVVVARSSFQLR